MEPLLRTGAPADLDAVAAIQDASPELSPWRRDSLARVLAGDHPFHLWVALLDGPVAGFLLWQALPDGEAEILSLAVSEPARRRGVAQALLTRLIDTNAGPFFLEVRVSNRAARALYGKLGFVEHGVRPAYYHRPVEDALLLRRG
ncbi:MAG: ribosomal protein S18-alanine N-acetyltransferase [Acidobacteria bacterium]|nr:ribosomal protein S18-alanine N-acetyltransferase [Acidobacteriota bacterium]